jgi:hypothetical protein
LKKYEEMKKKKKEERKERQKQGVIRRNKTISIAQAKKYTII